MELTKEIEERIALLISKWPSYGEFSLELPEITTPRKMKIVDGSNFLDPNNNIVEKALNDQKDEMTIMELDRERILKSDTEIIQLLIFEGFVINRHDIKVEGTIYRQLTDRGRELKELGSLEAFTRVQISKQNDRNQERLRNEYLYKLGKYQFYVNLLIGISTGIAAIYYLMEIHNNYPLFPFFWLY